MARPLSQLLNLFVLKTIFSFQHRNSHFAEHLWARGDRAARSQLQHQFRIPKAIQPARRLAKHRHILLEIHAYAAKKHFLIADVFFVGSRGSIYGEKGDIVAF
jgi:hypothetical protein